MAARQKGVDVFVDAEKGGKVNIQDTASIATSQESEPVASSKPRRQASLAGRLRMARKVKGWSQQDLADRAGTTQAVIQKIENGKSLRPRNVEAIADALGVEAAWLMFGTGESAGLSREAVAIARMWSELAAPDRDAIRESILRLTKRR